VPPAGGQKALVAGSGRRPTPSAASRLAVALVLVASTIVPAGAAAAAGEQQDGSVPGLQRAIGDQARSLAASAVGLPALASQRPAEQPAPASASPRREFYISWGYNADLFRPTDLHIAQPSIGNDFVLHDVRSHDDKGWTDLFDNSPTTVQYSARIGYFFNAKQDLAVELSFEHVRFLVTQDQTVRMSGTLNHAAVDQTVALTEDVLRYKLNNGANFLLVNLVKRLPLLKQTGAPGSLSVLLKGGAGFGFPHPTNFVFNQANAPGFQFGGFDLGVEGAVRFHLFRLLYLEFAQKGIYAHYSGLEVHEGRASHDIWTYLTALSIGTSIRLPGRGQP
jgi:hypothetical protein